MVDIMINPFAVAGKITTIQQEVLAPLYGTSAQYEDTPFALRLAETGRVIDRHQQFFEEVSRSSLVAMIFKIIQMFGGADGLTEQDFSRFTSYVNDGGLQAMIAMLKSDNMEKTFVDELTKLASHVLENAPPMLEKSRELHQDFIQGYLSDEYGSFAQSPKRLQQNFLLADEFILRLAELSRKTVEEIG